MNESGPKSGIGVSVEKISINDIIGLDPENLYFDVVKRLFLTDEQHDDLVEKINNSPNEGWSLEKRIIAMHVVDGKIEAKTMTKPKYSQQLGAHAIAEASPRQDKSSKLTTEQIVQNIQTIRAKINSNI